MPRILSPEKRAAFEKALTDVERGMTVAEVSKRIGITPEAFYKRRSTFNFKKTVPDVAQVIVEDAGKRQASKRRSQRFMVIFTDAAGLREIVGLQ